MMRRVTALLSVVLLVALLFTGCKKDTPEGKGFRFPLSAEPRQIDPQVSTDAASVTMVAALFEGLARLDETGAAVPAAATWTVSSDGLTYTFTLKDSKWSDGSDVKAQDFVFGMQRAVLPSTRSTLAEQLFDIKGAREVNAGIVESTAFGAKAISDKELVITLVEPNDGFPAKTAMTPFMPCNEPFFDATGGRYGLETKFLLTNGPFFLKKWNHNESLLLNKNTGYYDAASILPSAVRYMIGEVTDPIPLLTNGNLDAAPIPTQAIEAAKAAGLTLVPQQDTIQYIWLNNEIGALSSASVRRALRGALEWDTIYAQTNPEVTTSAKGFVALDALAFGNDKYRTETNALVPQTLGRDAATELYTGLQQQGLDKMPKLTLLCADDEYNMNLARYIVQSWQKNLSLYYTIQPVTTSELAARVKVGNYQIALFASTAPGSSALDALRSFATGAVGNLAHFSDENYDARLAQLTQGNVTRDELHSLEMVLWDAAPSIPLSFELRYVGIPANNSGIIVRSFGGGSFGAPYDFRRAGKLDN